MSLVDIGRHTLAKTAALRAFNDENIPSIVGKKIRYDSLRRFEPLTPAQEQVFTEYNKNKNLVLHGMPGTGKTFIAMYLAMKEILLRETNYEKIAVVRSTVPVRDIGFMPGTKEEKEAVYELPYKAIFDEIFYPMQGNGSITEKLKEQKLYEFISTSFIRGITLRNTIVIVDELENMEFAELDSILTRIGQNCKIIFCGDIHQSDLKKKSERDGVVQFMNILDHVSNFAHIEFNEEDIVRSELVKSYIIAKHRMGL